MAIKDPYMVMGAELEDEEYEEERPVHHTFEEDDEYFGSHHALSDSETDVDRGYHQEFPREDPYYHQEQHEVHANEDEERL